MGLKVTDNIDSVCNRHPVHCCKLCGTHLLSSAWIIPGDFRGFYGEAYFTSKLANNVISKKSQVRELRTGRFEVVDVHCTQCYTKIGWKYLSSSEPSQEYKIGKYVVEANLVLQVASECSLPVYLSSHLTEYAGIKDGTIDLDRAQQFVDALNSELAGEAMVDSDVVVRGAISRGGATKGTVVTEDAVIYSDESHYIEMSQDLIYNHKFPGSFGYYFSCNSGKATKRDPSTSLVGYSDKGFVLNAHDDSDNSEEEEVEQDEDYVEKDEENLLDTEETNFLLSRSHHRSAASRRSSYITNNYLTLQQSGYVPRYNWLRIRRDMLHAQRQAEGHDRVHTISFDGDDDESQ